ncbi:MAG: GC-type dockerin domain-anchored protein [Phycisphaerales bacterium]
MRGIVFVVLLGMLTSAVTQGQEVWAGYDVSFAKADFADWTLEENQDRITDNVWITRRDSGGLFNIAGETQFGSGSPSDTEWAIGTTADLGSLVFQSWRDAVMMCPPCVVDVDMVVHLITDDVYIDIRATSWTSADGGGFAYVRGAPPTPCNAVDLAEPYGFLDFTDVLAYLVAYANLDSAADIAVPIGIFDSNDIITFLNLFGGGCP